MALIKCSECGKEISDKAATCIHCGCPIEATNNNSKENEKIVEDKGTNGIDENNMLDEVEISNVTVDSDYLNKVKKITIILCIVALPTGLIVLIFYLILLATKNNKVILTNKRIKGTYKFLWNSEILNIPLDKIDNIYITKNFLKMTSISIVSASSIKKIRCVNIDNNFCDIAFKEIEKYKKQIYKKN